MTDRAETQRRNAAWCKELVSPQKAANKTTGVKKKIVIMALNIFRKDAICKT